MIQNKLDASYTVSQFSRTRMKLCGHSRTYDYLTSVLFQFPISSVGKSPHNADLYSVQDMEVAIQKFIDNKPDGKGMNNTDGVDMQALRVEKLVQDTKLVRQKNEIARLEIESKRNNLLEREDMITYLSSRMAIEGAILRKILLTQAPVEVTGLTIPKARKLCTDYYNELMRMYKESLSIFDERYPIRNIEDVIKDYDKET